MSLEEKILEGKYFYFKDEVQYSEELFTIYKETKPQGNFIFSSEILSRVSTGEFLKIQVDYELSHQFEPFRIRTKRALGNKQSTEYYRLNSKTKNLTYNFEGLNGKHQFDKIVNGKFHVATPAFLTSALMTQIKKMDSIQRTPYTIVSNNNLWTYEHEFFESEVIIELKSLDQIELNINGNNLSATHCTISDSDTTENEQATTSDFFLSKYFNIPYKAILPEGIEIKIDHLKTFEIDYKNMLK